MCRKQKKLKPSQSLRAIQFTPIVVQLMNVQNVHTLTTHINLIPKQIELYSCKFITKQTSHSFILCISYDLEDLV